MTVRLGLYWLLMNRPPLGLAGPTAPSHIWNVARTTTSADTTPDADAVRFERYSRMSPAEKAARVVDLTRAACTLALAGLRVRHPAADETQLLLRLAVLRLGAEIVGRAYGWRAPDGS